MKRLAVWLCAALIALAPAARAADNAVIMTPGTGVTFRSIDIGGGVQSMVHILGSSTGAAIYGTAGTANANVLSVQGIASMTPVLATVTGSLTNISGTISLPTGAATSANQTTEIASLASILAAIQGPIPACSVSPCTTVIGAVVPYQGTAVLSATNGGFTNVLQGNAVISATNGLYNNLLQGNAVISATNGLFANVLQGNAVLSATNGAFTNILQGNAVLSATNGTFANVLQGNAVLSVSNPSFGRSVAGATGGGTLSSAIAPATPAGVNLKASAGSVFRVFATTIQATPVYIKFYNSASAPTCGSGTPVGRFMVPAAATAANGAGTNIDIGDMGAAFGTGIGYCVTGALADADTTAITAANTLVNIVWN